MVVLATFQTNPLILGLPWFAEYGPNRRLLVESGFQPNYLLRNNIKFILREITHLRIIGIAFHASSHSCRRNTLIITHTPAKTTLSKPVPCCHECYARDWYVDS